MIFLNPERICFPTPLEQLYLNVTLGCPKLKYNSKNLVILGWVSHSYNITDRWQHTQELRDFLLLGNSVLHAPILFSSKTRKSNYI